MFNGMNTIDMCAFCYKTISETRDHLLKLTNQLFIVYIGKLLGFV